MRIAEAEYHKWFNPLMAPDTDKAIDLVDTIASLIGTEISRKRKRRPKDQEVFSKQVAALVSNLACHVIEADHREVQLHRSHRHLGVPSRYKPAFMTRAFTTVLDAFEQACLIEQTLGAKVSVFADKGEATTILPTGILDDLVTHAGLTLSDFKVLPPHETIILKDCKLDRWDTGKPIEYRDTEVTHRWRNEMHVINQWLAQADITYCDQPINLGQRHLRRIFTGKSFSNCGRLYGGLWQTIPQVQRKESLRINGESVAELDYGQMILRTAYAKAGVEPPDSDLYTIAPWGKEYREGFKTLIASMLFQTRRLRKKPKGSASRLPTASVQTLCYWVEQAHPGIAHLLYKGVGLELMHAESEMIVRLLLDLSQRDIVALPIHDSVLVPRSSIDVVEEVMRKAFSLSFNAKCLISRS